MKYEKIFDDNLGVYVITPIKEDYDDILPVIMTIWQHAIEAQDYDEYNHWKFQLDECNSILFKALDKTRRHTRQTSEAYKKHRKTLPSYNKNLTGNKTGRPKIRNEDYWKEYRKNYYKNVVKPKRHNKTKI